MLYILSFRIVWYPILILGGLLLSVINAGVVVLAFDHNNGFIPVRHFVGLLGYAVQSIDAAALA